MVNIRLLRKINLGEKGDVINIDKKGANELIKENVAELIQDRKSVV